MGDHGNTFSPPAQPRAGFDRSRRAFARRALGLAALSGVGACGGGGGADAAVAALVVPIFLYAFVGSIVADDMSAAEVRLTLSPQNPLSHDGSFVRSTLRISFATGRADEYRVTGTFSGEDFMLDVEGAASPVAASYRGSFTDRNTLRLLPTDGSLRPNGTPRPVLDNLRRNPALP